VEEAVIQKDKENGCGSPSVKDGEVFSSSGWEGRSLRRKLMGVGHQENLRACVG
jgi:hypothetical protein